MENLTELESAWLIWSEETGVDMDQAFADYSTPQQWLDVGIFPGDHELLIVQGYSPDDVQNYGFQGISASEVLREPSFCSRLRLWLANGLIWILGYLFPSSEIFTLLFQGGKFILSIGDSHNAHGNRNHC